MVFMTSSGDATKDATETMENQQVTWPQSEKAVAKNRTTKVVIVSLAAIVVVAAIVTGFVLALQYSNEISKDLIKAIPTCEPSAQPEAAENNVQRSHENKDGRETWTQHDFDRMLSTHMVRGADKPNDKSACYVSPLNRSLVDSETGAEAAALTAAAPAPAAVRCIAGPEAISNPSFLGPTASRMCAGLPVYWDTPDNSPDTKVTAASAGDPEDDVMAAPTGRCRWICRSGCGLKVCAYAVWIDYSNCYFYIYHCY